MRFERKSTLGPAPLYCSKKCKNSWHSNHRKDKPANATCIICRKPFHSVSAYQCCSLACSIIKRTQTAQAMRIEKICRCCGKIFYVDGHHQFARYCSKACNDAVNCHVRRFKLSLDKEDFAPIEIYERDGWICQICHKPVERRVNGKNPLQPSLDHVIPISLGGSHTKRNVRCTHLKCNVERKNRISDQLLLIG